MNPYAFVPFFDKSDVGGARRSAPDHDTLGGLSGTLVCELEALSPLLIMDPHRRASGGASGGVGTFCQHPEPDGTFYVPGASLKGLVRSVFEAITPSCVRLAAKGRFLVPRWLEPCSSRDRACPACRAFGFITGNDTAVHRGVVQFGEAKPIGQVREVRPDLQVVPLSNPNPRHDAFYGTPHDPAGRKFYFHHHGVSTPQNENERERGPLLRPLAGRGESTSGATFRFSVTFDRLDDDALSALVAALVLSWPEGEVPTTTRPGVRHKLGYGKPAGLGSVEVRLTRVELRPAFEAGSFFARSEEMEGEALETWTQDRTDRWFGFVRRGGQGWPYAAGESQGDPARDLARILRFPADPDVGFRYPSYDWFKATDEGGHPLNSQKPLSQTP